MSHWLSQAVVTPILGKTGTELQGGPHAPGPIRVVVGKSNATNVKSFTDSYAESEVVPHFTHDVAEHTVYQHIPMDHGAVRVTNFPVEPHRMGTTIWVNALTPVGEALTSRESHSLGGFVVSLCYLLGVEPTLSEDDLTLGQWMTFSGIILASDVPHCTASTPGMNLSAFEDGLADPDGVFEEELYETVEVVETPDIIVGPDTIKFSDIVLEPEVASVPTMLGEFPGRAVSLGSGGKAVALLREALGWDEGKFDDDLEGVVVDYQQAAELEPSGVLDNETWEAIDQALLMEEAELVENEGESEPSDN